MVTYVLYNKMAMASSGHLILLHNLDKYKINFLVHCERNDGRPVFDTRFCFARIRNVVGLGLGLIMSGLLMR